MKKKQKRTHIHRHKSVFCSSTMYEETHYLKLKSTQYCLFVLFMHPVDIYSIFIDMIYLLTPHEFVSVARIREHTPTHISTAHKVCRLLKMYAKWNIKTKSFSLWITWASLALFRISPTLTPGEAKQRRVLSKHTFSPHISERSERAHLPRAHIAQQFTISICIIKTLVQRSHFRLFVFRS